MRIKLQSVLPVLAGALILVAGCGDPLNNGGNGNGQPTPPAVTPEITIPSTEDLTPAIAAEGGSATVSFKSAADWTAAVSATKAGEWISVSPTSGKAGDAKITITVQKNEDSEAREATVTLKSGTVSKEIKVSQEAGKPKDPDWYTKKYWERTDRERAGLIGPVRTIRETEWAPCTEFEYDQAGHLLTEKYFQHQDDETPSSTIYHTYDASGRRIRTASFKEGDTPVAGVDQEITYAYDNGGKLVIVGPIANLDRCYAGNGVGFQVDDILVGLSSIRKWDYNDPLHKRYWDTDYVLDDSGNMVVKEYSFWTSSLDGRDGERSNEYRSEYTITFDGNYPKSIRYYGNYGSDLTWQDNGMPARVETLQYEDTYKEEGDRHFVMVWATDNPRYIMLTSYDQDGGHVGVLATKNFTQTHNEYGDILRKDAGIGQGGVTSYYEDYRDYKYDKYGNWISRNMEFIGLLDRQVSTSHYERKIVYF